MFRLTTDTHVKPVFRSLVSAASTGAYMLDVLVQGVALFCALCQLRSQTGDLIPELPPHARSEYMVHVSPPHTAEHMVQDTHRCPTACNRV